MRFFKETSVIFVLNNKHIYNIEVGQEPLEDCDYCFEKTKDLETLSLKTNYRIKDVSPLSMHPSENLLALLLYNDDTDQSKQ
jgi:hypothetical protein